MATKAASRVVQTPGEPVQIEETNPDAELANGDAFTANVVTSGADDPDAAKDEMAELKAQMAALMQQNAMQQAAINNLARGVQASRPVAPELPGLSDLDTETIKAPVLTKDGWFVPAGYGANPAAPKL